jgi:glucose/arabinose dehydrogenase
MAAFAGTGQQAMAGTAVAVAPAVRLTDAQGRGVAGVPVSFVVVAGGGFVNGPTTASDASGVARVSSWTLGLAPGTNQLAARAAGMADVTFSAQGTAAAGLGSLTAGNGDNQTAPIGTALPIAPSVVVKSAGGATQAGVAVSFTVASGGGSVQNATATSDANGIASPGRWTLGNAAGMQTLTASAQGFTSVQLKATATAAGTPTLARTVLLGGLQNPWDMAFTPDGAMLYTERSRGLSVRLANGTTRLLVRPNDLVAQGQSGMLGVAIDPQFATNRAVYAYFSSNAGGNTDNRVVAFTVDAGYTAVAGRRDIVTGITYANNGTHSGGRIRFGPDGYLYVTTGDTWQGRIPQSLTDLGAKVLRVDRDGNAAPGNNAIAGANPRIYAYGFRNVQGIGFRPSSGVPYIAEHGPGYTDEVTPLRAGGNGGWDPFCSQGSAQGIQYCGYNGVVQMTDTTRFPNAMRPAWTTGNRSEGMAGGTFLSGAQWREWDGAFVAALLAGKRLEVLKLDAAGATAQSTPILNTLDVRLRGVAQGPDGTLYVATDGKPGGDEIWRVAPN